MTEFCERCKRLKGIDQPLTPFEVKDMFKNEPEFFTVYQCTECSWIKPQPTQTIDIDKWMNKK